MPRPWPTAWSLPPQSPRWRAYVASLDISVEPDHGMELLRALHAGRARRRRGPDPHRPVLPRVGGHHQGGGDLHLGDLDPERPDRRQHVPRMGLLGPGRHPGGPARRGAHRSAAGRAVHPGHHHPALGRSPPRLGDRSRHRPGRSPWPGAPPPPAHGCSVTVPPNAVAHCTVPGSDGFPGHRGWEVGARMCPAVTVVGSDGDRSPWRWVRDSYDFAVTVGVSPARGRSACRRAAPCTALAPAVAVDQPAGRGEGEPGRIEHPGLDPGRLVVQDPDREGAGRGVHVVGHHRLARAAWWWWPAPTGWRACRRRRCRDCPSGRGRCRWGS